MKIRKGYVQTTEYKIGQAGNILPPGLTEVREQRPPRDLLVQQNKKLEIVLTPRERELFHLALSNASSNAE